MKSKDGYGDHLVLQYAVLQSHTRYCQAENPYVRGDLLRCTYSSVDIMSSFLAYYCIPIQDRIPENPVEPIKASPLTLSKNSHIFPLYYVIFETKHQIHTACS